MIARKLITCILPKGVALQVLSALKAEHGVVAAHINYARGSGKITPLAYRGLGGQSEKELLTVVVDAQSADEIFDFIYRKANINRPHGGLMYQCALARSTAFTLPDLPNEA